MPKIVKIQYRDNHIAVDLDHGETLKLPHSVARAHRLETDRELESLEYGRLREESERFCCMDRALGYLSFRARSAFEMSAYLKKKKFSPAIIEEVIRELKEKRYLDDRAYALALVQSTMRKKAVGINLLKHQLTAKGLSRSIIDWALRESGASETDMHAVYETARKKFDSLRGDEKRLGRVYRFLLQRGFPPDAAGRTVKQLKSEDYPEMEDE